MLVTWRFRMCDMTCSYIYCDKTRSYHNYLALLVWHTSIADMTRSKLWYCSLTCAWLFDMCDMAHRYAWHNSSAYVAWLMHSSSQQYTSNVCEPYSPANSLILLKILSISWKLSDPPENSLILLENASAHFDRAQAFALQGKEEEEYIAQHPLLIKVCLCLSINVCIHMYMYIYIYIYICMDMYT